MREAGRSQQQDLVADIKELADEYARLTRRSVEIAWELGGKMIEAERTMSRDDWVNLVNNKMPYPTRGILALRFAKLRRVHPYKSQIGHYESVTQALMGKSKSRPRKRNDAR